MTATTVESGFRLPPGPVDLSTIATDDTPGFDGDKAAGEAALAELGPELADVQERLFAERTTGSPRRILLVLQGMDTSGKGGVLRHTVGLVDPQGVKITAFKAPTEEELRHDFLWRIRRAVPEPGYVGVFDRSHYEDVLIGRVHALADEAEIERRYGAINEFEQELLADGTQIVKCMLHISAAEQKERLLARLDDPTKYWKFNPGDVDERAHWACLPGGVRDRPGAHQHRGRAVARRSQRPEVVPQPHHRPAAARWAGTDESGLAGGRLRRGGAAGPPGQRGADHVIPTVGVTRYVTPLREGGSLPGVVEGDDLGTYVCKFRGAGQGVRVLVAEVIVGELARRIGLSTPRLVALELDPEIARYEADEEVQDLLNASPGLNLGIDFLPGSFGFDGDTPGGEADAAKILWLDAFCANVDRTWRNPNLLLWHGQLWVIDHGAALYFHHGWTNGVTDPARFAQQPWDPTNHVLLGRAAGLGEVDAELAGQVDETLLTEVVALVPDSWLEPRPGAETPDAVRAAYVAFLTARLQTRQWLPTVGAR